MKIKEKVIEITVSINTGSIESPVYEDTTLTGLRMKVAVLGGTMSGQGQLQCSIEGLSQNLMSKLTVTGFIRQENRNNKIMVAAGDKGGVLSVVYEGVILEAYVNVTQPASIFQIIALSALGAAIAPVGATSFKGSQKVSYIMSVFAKEAGFLFKNEGVDDTLNNPYFTGSTWDKIKRTATAAGIIYAVNKNTLTIWNDGKETKDNVIISASKGESIQMIGTPKVGGSGLSIRILFYPDLQFSKSYEVVSKDFALSSGLWIPTGIMHDLEARVDNGSWFTNIEFKRAL